MRELIASYVAQGWAPVWIPPLSKAPRDRDWTKRDYQPDHWYDGDNVGIKLGDASGGLVDVDLDCAEAVQLASLFLPPTATFGRASKPRSHWLYRAPETKTWKPKRAAVELRSTGAQTVFPPSVRGVSDRDPPGSVPEEIAWYDWPEAGPVTIDPAELRAHVCRLALGAMLLRLLPPLQEAHGVHDFLLAFAGGLRRAGWTADAAVDLVARSIGLDEPHREPAIRDTFAAEENTTGWPTVTELVGPPDAKALQKLAEDSSLRLQQIQPAAKAAIVSGYTLNDLGNAGRLVDLFGEHLRFIEGIGWLRWDGQRWAPSDGPWAEASWISQTLIAEGHALGNAAGKALIEHGRQSGNARRLAASLEIASHRPEVRLHPDDLDRDPWLLNCTNGTIDLRTGVLHEPNREHLITKMVPVAYDERAECPRFDQFLRETMAGDLELMAYLLRFLGYGITGLTSEHVFGLWYGPIGRNGKGTLIRALLHVLGDYAITIAPELLLHQLGTQHSTGLLDFRGARLALSNEAPEGKRWNESLVKQLTGGDAIRARAMRQDFVEFRPSHTLVVAANTRPLVREQGPAFWSRVHLLPWEVSFLGREDRTLDDQLAAEAPGILRYLVAGCLAWQGMGINPPTVMRTAGQDYRASQDTIGAFLEDTIAAKTGNRVNRAAVYRAYRQWALDGGEPFLLSARAFHRQLEERQFATIKTCGQVCYVDMELRRGG